MNGLNEIITIKNRIREQLILEFGNEEIDINNTLESLREKTICADDGTMYFSDIDYQSENRAAWPVLDAFSRILRGAASYQKITEQGNKELLLRLVRGHLLYLSRNHIVSSNWWYNEIGIPQKVGRILLLMEGLLNPETVAGMLSYLEVGSFSKNEKVFRHEGANLLWISEVSILYAVFMSDTEALQLASKMASMATFGTDVAGVQSDGSFFQHGKFVYSTGYGRSFIQVLCPLIYYLNNTSFAFSKEAVDNLLIHLLDGVRLMSFGSSFDYLTMGREYIRLNAVGNSSLAFSLAYLLKCEDISRQNEIKEFYDEINTQSSKLSLTKYFDVGHFLISRNPYLYCSWKTLGDGMVTAEICNRENVLGINYTYGTSSCTMRSGKEYFNVAPLLKYDFIPGTTSRCETDEELISHPEFHWSTPGRVVCNPELLLDGGICTDGISVAILEVKHSGVHQRSCALATPYGMVYTGSAVTCDGGEALHTTIEQCNLLYDLKEQGSLISHGDICYLNLSEDTEFKCSVEHRIGNWNRISLFKQDSPVEGDILTIYVEHHDSVGHYAYEILPREYLEHKSKLLILDEKIHAVRLSDGREVYIFFEDACLNNNIRGKRGDILVI